jgi:Ca-activated chloride channel family protein
LGRVVVPQLDAARLQRLAAVGGGRFARLVAGDRDLDTLFPAPNALPLDAALDTQGGGQYEADVWSDRGAWLAVLLLPFLALCFRRGWIAVLALVVIFPATRAHAFEWQDLWQRRDQRGYEALQMNEAARAAELFVNPEWRSAAQYRAEAFDASAATLTNLDTATAHYNRGNALAKGGALEAAIGAYDRALELEPDHEDALYNRAIVEQFLKDNPQQQPPPEEGQGQQSQQGDSSDSQGQSGEQQEGEDSQDGEQGQSGESNAGNGTNDTEEPSEGEPEGEEQEPEQNANAGDESDAGAETAPGPEEIERWASEQAAEQWLRRIPQDPGGLLRRKFLYQYQRFGLDQDGNRVLDGAAAERRPW